MATMIPGGMSERPASLKNAAILRLWRGMIIVSGWPKKRGPPKQAYQRASLERWKVLNRMVKHTPAPERIAMGDGLKQFLDTHTGLRASAAIRLRDWFTAIYTGRAFYFSLPDGSSIYPSVIGQEVSDLLDWTEPRVGSLLTRTDKGWLPTVQCAPGRVLCQLPPDEIPGACPPASQAPKSQAVGGY